MTSQADSVGLGVSLCFMQVLPGIKLQALQGQLSPSIATVSPSHKLIEREPFQIDNVQSYFSVYQSETCQVIEKWLLPQCEVLQNKSALRGWSSWPFPAASVFNSSLLVFVEV